MKRALVLIMGVVMLFGLFGCGSDKDSGTKKTDKKTKKETAEENTKGDGKEKTKGSGKVIGENAFANCPLLTGDTWAQKAAQPVPGKEESGGDDAAREEPYYWTMSLTGTDYVGGGYYADVVLYFDDTTLHVRINGRELVTIPYYADRNAYSEDDQVVLTDGFFCRGGWITELKYQSTRGNDDRLCGTMIREDGTTEEVVFHTGSEEYLYLADEGDQ
ncbi:MAG: hypothetical protein K6B72_04705 [Lachnospiraceae bacterium]|nr:hypothetical protein [Lachnospiraceae bacterium]